MILQKPLVSICIPSYNHARFLPAAIESALAQTYRPIEIVVAGHPNRGISATINFS